MARNTCKYREKIGGKTVGFGITNDLDRREQEKKTKDPRIHLTKEGRKTSKDAAREWEKKKTEDWKKTHGRLPGKNKQIGG